MTKCRFLAYSRSLCIKINVATAMIVWLLFSCATLVLRKVESDVFASVDGLNNGAGAMLGIVFLGGIVGILLVSYSLFVPWVMPLFYHFADNFKSLISLAIGNLSIAYFLFIHFTLQLALCYFFLASAGMCWSLYWRYNRRGSLS